MELPFRIPRGAIPQLSNDLCENNICECTTALYAAIPFPAQFVVVGAVLHAGIISALFHPHTPNPSLKHINVRECAPLSSNRSICHKTLEHFCGLKATQLNVRWECLAC